MPLVMLAAELYLAWSYRAAFAPMLHAHTPLPSDNASRGAPEAVHGAA